jgi:tetratricopeptide (TPR) repeat protein
VRNFRSQFGWLVVQSACLALLAGCHFPGREGPVSQSLAESRKLTRQGISALQQGQQQEAEKLLARAVQACPADGEARGNYAEALWQRGARAEAVKQMEEASHQIVGDAAFWSRLAEMYLALGRTDAAAQSVQQALDIDSKLASAWTVRGAVMRASGQPRQALADDLRALGYAPGDRRILLEVAELYRQLDEPERSLQTLQTLADSYAPGEEPQQVLYLTGLAYLALSRPAEAVESFSGALMRGNPTPDLFCRLGEAELLTGHPAEAANAAAQALAIDPKSPGGRELLRRIETAQRPPEAGKVTR